MGYNFKSSRNSDIGINRKKTRVQTASIIVASDGTGDFEELQEAINSLKTGGVIQIKEGTYNIKKTITITSNITIIGTGKTIFSTTTNNLKIFTINTNSTEIKIENLTFQGNGSQTGIFADTSTTYIKIKECNFLSLAIGLDFYEGNWITISNNFFHNLSGTFMYVMTGPIVIQNNLTNEVDYGIRSRGLTGGGIIVGNYFSSIGTDEWVPHIDDSGVVLSANSA